MKRSFLFIILFFILSLSSHAAIQRVGSVTDYHNLNNAGSTTITVPTGSTLLVLGMVGYSSTGDRYFGAGTVSIGGQAMSVGREDDSPANVDSTAIFYLVNPPSGSQTLAWDWVGSSNMNDGGHFFIAFYNGTNTTSPIYAGNGTIISGTGNGSISINGSAGYAMVSAAYSDPAGSVITWTNLSSISQDDSVTRGTYAENLSISGPTAIRATSNATYLTYSAMIITPSVEVALDYCYQGPANVSTACGASGTGKYDNLPYISAADGSWTTYWSPGSEGLKTWNVTYANVIGGPYYADILQHKIRSTEILNSSIPASCRYRANQTGNLTFRVDAYQNGTTSNFTVTISCYNTSSTYERVAYNYSTTGGVTFYEMALYHNISSWNYCYYGGFGNYTIYNNDACIINTNVSIGGNWLVLNGTGITRVFANITGVSSDGKRLNIIALQGIPRLLLYRGGGLYP